MVESTQNIFVCSMHPYLLYTRAKDAGQVCYCTSAEWMDRMVSLRATSMQAVSTARRPTL